MKKLPNAVNMRNRIHHRGGPAQQDRMIKDKRWALNHALFYSYQGANVRKIEDERFVRALINPNKVKQDYDDKIISIGYEYGYRPGTVFEWYNTGTYWLIYLQDLTELAYFRGDIRRCSYTIDWIGEDGQVYSTYAAIRGPVETKINYIQKNGISMDTPNHTLNLLIPKSKEALLYFRRYSKFYLQGLSEGDENICWRVEAKDSISIPGILEINATEYYANPDEDDMEEGLVGGLVVKPIEPEPVLSEIKGEQFIKPKMKYTYTYSGTDESEWYIDPKYPIEKKIDGKTITLKWMKTFSGEFVLKYGDCERTIVVDSLF